MLASVRKPGLTFAPEVGTDRLRLALRKHITNEALFRGLRAAYEAGWRSVKLYFLCGIPGETDDDLTAIHELTAHTSRLGKEVFGSCARVNVAVSWLVPKPHTPLQWAAQQRPDYFAHVRRTLAGMTRRSRLPIRLRFHNPQRSVLESVLARGDRRLSQTIERAWQLGARFDAWDESFKPTIWDQAFEHTQLRPDEYAHRRRSCDEFLPWQHIQAGPPPDHLKREYEAFLASIAPDRRASELSDKHGAPS
jgi:radical SAM superfamily enzyme YgiQ (UPF0313 family)